MEPVQDSKNLSLYNNLIGSKKVSVEDIGDFDQFDSVLKDPVKAGKLHDNLLNDGRFTQEDIGTKEQFLSSLDPVTPPAPEKPVEPQTQTMVTPYGATVSTPKITTTKPKEDDHWKGFGGEIADQTQSGTESLVAAAYGVPSYAFDFVGAGFRALGINVPLYKDSWGKPVEVGGVNINPLARLEKEKNNLLQAAKANDEEVRKANPELDRGVFEPFKKGDIQTGLRNMFSSIAQSAPSSAAMMASGGLSTAAQVGAGAALFGSQNTNQADIENDYGLVSRDALLAINAITGSFESVFETSLGSGAVGKGIIKLVKDKGKKVAREEIKDSFTSSMVKMMIENPWMAPFGEAFEEMGTQISQNLVNKYSGYKPNIKVSDGVVDAGLIGFGMGGIHGGMIQTVKSLVGANGESAPTQPADSTPTPTIDPRSIAEQKARAFHQTYADKNTGLLKTVYQVTPGDAENLPWTVTSEWDEIAPESGKTRHMYLAQTVDGRFRQFEAGEVVDKGEAISEDDFAAQSMGFFDQQEQAKQDIQNNEISFNGQKYSLTGDMDKNGYVAINQETDEMITIPAKDVDKAKAMGNNPDIITRTYGKSEVTGTRDAQGNIVLMDPMSVDQAESLNMEVEKATGGKATVVATLVPNQDVTQPEQYQVSIIPKTQPAPGAQGETVATPSDTPADSRQVEEKPAEYLFRGNPISKEEAHKRVNKAILLNDKSITNDLTHSDPEITDKLNKKFPVPKPVFKVNGTKLNSQETLDFIEVADTMDELNLLKHENIESDPVVYKAYTEKVKQFLPETANISENTESKVAENINSENLISEKVPENSGQNAVNETVPNQEVTESSQLLQDSQFANQESSQNKELDPLEKDILEVQNRLGIQQTAPVNISDNTELTLDKIDRGEPVTNEFIKSASDELYASYKMLEAMKKSDQRAYTLEQIESMQEYLGEEITNLENHANRQTEKGEFINKDEAINATQGGAEEVTGKTQVDEKPVEQQAETPGVTGADQGKDTPQEKQGEGVQKGLEENVDSQPEILTPNPESHGQVQTEGEATSKEEVTPPVDEQSTADTSKESVYTQESASGSAPASDFKVGDRVTTKFLGAPLTGTVVAEVGSNGKLKVKSDTGTTYPVKESDTVTEGNQLPEVDKTQPLSAVLSNAQKAMDEKRSNIRKKVAELSKKASNALKTVIVNSANELPQNVKDTDMYRNNSGDIDAVYNEADGTMYIVADTINPDEIVAKWIHEQGIHRGLRVLFKNPKQLIDVLNKVFDSVGIEEIYNVVPMQYLDLYNEGLMTKDELAEEYLAYLGEKILNEEELTPVQQTSWDKFLETVSKLLQKVYGKSSLSNKDIADIIRSSAKSLYGKEVIETSKRGENIVPPKFSVHNHDQLREKTANLLRRLGNSEERIAQIIGNADILTAIARSADYNWAVGAGVKGQSAIRDNSDDLYKKSLDMAADCIKRIEFKPTYKAFRQAIEKEFGRGVKDSDIVILMMQMKDDGHTTPCVYCYVESPRRSVEEMASRWRDSIFGKTNPQLVKSDEGGHKAAILEDLRKEAELGTFTKEDIDSDQLLGEKPVKEINFSKPITYKAKTFNTLHEAMVVLTTSQAKKAVPYEEYNNDVLSFPKSLIEHLNNSAGFRWFSSSDFVPEHIVDLAQVVMDMEAVGLGGHAYTKVEDFVKIFGNTGLKINLSLFMNPNEELKENPQGDSHQSFDFEKAKKYREQFKNVGTEIMAVTTKQIEWALNQSWIDYIIPYHASGFRYNKELGWEDFSHFQHETWINGKPSEIKQEWIDNGWVDEKGKITIRQKHYGGTKGISNADAKENYLNICKEIGVKPVFADVKLSDGRSVTEHDDYIKLKKDYARIDSPLETVKTSGIDTEHAGKVIRDYTEKMKDPDTVIDAIDNPNVVQANSVKQESIDKVLSLIRNNNGDPVSLSDFLGKKNVKFSVKRTEEEVKQVEQTAKEHFGTTTNFKEAGYLTQDGSMLDFSGKKIGGSSGTRTIDHGEINEIGTEMYDFIEMGNIRLSPESNGMELISKPTKQQQNTLASYIRNGAGKVWVDFLKKADNGAILHDHAVAYNSATPSKVLNDVNRYFDEGIKPITNVRFSTLNREPLTKVLNKSKEATRFSIIGQKGAASIDQVVDNLATAKEMESSGKDPKTIYLATGWEKFPDGWKYDLHDTDKVNKPLLNELADLSKFANKENIFQDVNYRKNEDGTYDLTMMLENGKNTDDFMVLRNKSRKYVDRLLEDNPYLLSKIDRDLGADSYIGGNMMPSKEIKGRFKVWVDAGALLPEVLDNPQLYDAYPSLKRVVVMAKTDIQANAQAVTYGNGQRVIEFKNPKRLGTFSSLMHEIQHHIQDLEGFASGGSYNIAIRKFIDDVKADLRSSSEYKEDFDNIEKYNDRASKERVADAILSKMKETTGKTDGGEATHELYRRIAGESESRNVQSRLDLTPEQRRETMISETEDVAPDQKIYIRTSLASWDANEPSSKGVIEKPEPVRFSTKTIEVDGVERPTTNSEGKPIHPTEEGVKNFWKWFGDSKVVDKEGRPLVVYHGTEGEFSEFIPKGRTASFFGKESKGVYFTDSYSEAVNYSTGAISTRSNFARPSGSPKVIEAYIKADYLHDVRKWNETKIIGDNSKGKLGATIHTPFGSDGNHYFVKNASQIKSATGNNGEFSPENPKILFSTKTKPLSKVLADATKAYEKTKKEKRGWKETFEGIRKSIQDQDLSVRRLEEAVKSLGGKILDNSKPYRQMQLAYGRMEHLYRKFTDDIIKPIQQIILEMKKDGVDTKTVLSYTIAKHALERNAAMRDKEFADWLKANEKESDDVKQKKYDDLQNKDYSGVTPFSEEWRMVYEGLDKWMEKNPFASPEEIRTKMDELLNQYNPPRPDVLAQQIVDDFEKMANPDMVDRFWKAIRKATEFTVETWHKGNTISDETRDEYLNKYKHFVPLRGWRQGDVNELPYNHGAEGFGKSLQHATGRRSLAANPLAYLQKVAFQAIGEQMDTEVKQQLLNLVKYNQGSQFKDLFRIKKAYYVRTLLPDGSYEWSLYLDQDGNIAKPPEEMFDSGDAKSTLYTLHERYRPPAQAREHEVTIKSKNGDIIIVMPSKMIDVAQAINRTNKTARYLFTQKLFNTEDWNKPLSKTFGGVTNKMKGAMTQWNVTFPLKNFFRDAPEAILTQMIKNENGLGVLKDYSHSFPVIARRIAGSKRAKSKWDDYGDEFYEIGGATGFTHLKSAEEIEQEMEKQMERFIQNGTISGKMLDMPRKALQGIVYWNMLFEDATRLSVYMSSREMGLSKEESASNAKEASVNFNRKGTLSKAFESWFGFFNAGIQGTVKNLAIYKRYPKASSAVALSFVALGFFEAMMNDMMGGDDDDKKYWNVSEYMRQNYLLIPNLPKYFATGDKGDMYLSVPLPHFWRAFKSLGTLSYEAMEGRITPVQVMTKFASNFLVSTLPVDVPAMWQDGEFNLLRPFVPTSVRPLYEAYVSNKDFTGATIAKEPFTKQQEADLAASGLGKSNVNVAVRFFTDAVFRAAGGNNETKYYMDKDGNKQKVFTAADLNPSKIEHVIEGYTAGTGKFVMDIAKTAINAINPKEEVDFKDLPFVNAFIRKTPEAKWKVIKDFYNLKSEISGIDALSRAYYSDENYEKYKEVASNGYYQEYAARIKGMDKAVQGAMKNMDFKTASGSEKVLDLMKKAIQDIKDLKQKYNKK